MPPKNATPVALTPVDQKEKHVEPVTLTDTYGKYAVVPKIRKPLIKHDNGFLEKPSDAREPSASDYIAAAKWKSILKLGELECRETGKGKSLCDFEDQTDALAAYRYFWEGGGKDRFAVDYEKFLREEPTAKNLITKLVDEFIAAIEVVGKNRSQFLVVSSPYYVGPGGISETPASVNWRRTLGVHKFWVSASVSASAKDGHIVYSADLTVHVEDRYNFNPGGVDQTSKKRDEENGAFEQIKWAHQYMNYANIARGITWIEKMPQSKAIVAKPPPPHQDFVSNAWGYD